MWTMPHESAYIDFTASLPNCKDCVKRLTFDPSCGSARVVLIKTKYLTFDPTYGIAPNQL